MTHQRPGILSPLVWSTVSSIGTQALAFVTFAILARLLGAATFGLVAMAALVIDLLLVISGAGINEAVVQRRALDECDADTAFWANLACGMLFTLLTIAIAPLVSLLFGQPDLTPVTMALAAIFTITPLGAIHTARLTRDLRFRSVAIRNLVAALAGAAVGLPMALLGFGVWALVAQRIAFAGALVLAVWASYPWWPRMRFRRQTCAEMIRFGGYLGLSRTLNQLNIRCAELISGALIGPVAVAFIRAGSRVMEVLNQITYTPFQQVSMPVLARAVHGEAEHGGTALRESYLQLSRLSSFLMFPAFLGCVTIADEIVALVFGPGWEPVADAIRIFACAVVASQMNNLIIGALAATGESRQVLSWTTLQIVAGIAAAALAARWGWQAMLMTGVARGYLILPYGFHLLRTHTGITLREVIASLRPALSSSCLMAAIVLPGVQYCESRMSEPAILALWLPIAAVIYFGAFAAQDRTVFVQLRRLAKARKACAAA
ncbi:lipopolysaccharide biosynthesis protein [Novosphingobium clariflavum]|mgnify:CR=1 FL=1|uniref:Lipopolysaccharide biosynthesis protein n=1 Tax=Novosphingobium clariflavum TaxID=2029884 RepID=A0ABV6S8B5_9SPHN|nr:lipopolysaccharide biosynthesis protein [Novosphingobium clariflavum]